MSITREVSGTARKSAAMLATVLLLSAGFLFSDVNADNRATSRLRLTVDIPPVITLTEETPVFEFSISEISPAAGASPDQLDREQSTTAELERKVISVSDLLQFVNILSGDKEQRQNVLVAVVVAGDASLSPEIQITAVTQEGGGECGSGNRIQATTGQPQVLVSDIGNCMAVGDKATQLTYEIGTGTLLQLYNRPQTRVNVVLTMSDED